MEKPAGAMPPCARAWPVVRRRSSAVSVHVRKLSVPENIDVLLLWLSQGLLEPLSLGADRRKHRIAFFNLLVVDS